MKVAEGFRALDAEWFTSVLGKPVAAADAEPLVVSGVTTDMARLRVAFSNGGETTLIGKLRGRDEMRRQMDAAMGLFERESRFYAELARELPIRTARLVHAGDGQSTPLLLEDLGGLRAGDQAAGLSAADAELCLDALADLHAAWWRSERLASPWLTRPAESPFRDLVAQQMISGLGRLEDFADHVAPGTLGRIPRDLQRWQGFLTRLGDGPHTLAHVDCRLDNVFFDDDTRAAIFVDWQTVGSARGAQDLANLLGGSMDPDLLTANWRPLLERYHARLLQRGVSGYSFEELLLHYRQSLIWPLGQGLSLLGAHEASDPRQVGPKNVVRALTHLTELDTFEALEER